MLAKTFDLKLGRPLRHSRRREFVPEAPADELAPCGERRSRGDESSVLVEQAPRSNTPRRSRPPLPAISLSQRFGDEPSRHNQREIERRADACDSPSMNIESFATSTIRFVPASSSDPCDRGYLFAPFSVCDRRRTTTPNFLSRSRSGRSLRALRVDILGTSHQLKLNRLAAASSRREYRVEDDPAKHANQSNTTHQRQNTNTSHEPSRFEHRRLPSSLPANLCGDRGNRCFCETQFCRPRPCSARRLDRVDVGRSDFSRHAWARSQAAGENLVQHPLLHGPESIAR